LNQTQGFSGNVIKHRILWLDSLWALLLKINPLKISSKSALLGLSKHLYQWNKERITLTQLTGSTVPLTVQDVDLIKNKIQVALSKANIKDVDTFADQILFLSIGAIQIQSQTNSDQAWQLVRQAINSHVNHKQDKRLFAFATLSIICLICISMITHQKPHTIQSTPSANEIETAISGTDPVTISMLQLAYQKMQSGTCQLPQAAMLPIKQRTAFLMFVNKGAIDVNHVEDLRLALGYVNCLYPQQLMRPQLPN
jgi:hypothetical protein